MTLPLWEPDPVVLAALNTAVWFFLQMGIAWLGTRLPAKLVPVGWRFFDSGPVQGRLCAFFQVKRWKHLAPDGAALFAGGVAKAHLSGRKDPAALRIYLRETCRGELVHWAVLCAVPLFFLFNPPAVWWVHYAVGLCLNLPCILIQRCNRPRLKKVILRLEEQQKE
ncbi:MAG: hypothetical protein ACQEQV_01230 [Fibrobacterota bacterium]